METKLSLKTRLTCVQIERYLRYDMVCFEQTDKTIVKFKVNHLSVSFGKHKIGKRYEVVFNEL